MRQLFGSKKRTDYLVGIAVYGPTTGRSLGRSLNIDAGYLPALYRHFDACGVIRRNESGLIELDVRFPGHDALLVLLNALGGRRVVVFPLAEAPAQRKPRHQRLFGTAIRTRTLVALSRVSSANLAELSKVAHVPVRSIVNVVDHFERIGVLVTERVDHGRVVRFDEAEPNASFLIALLEEMQRLQPGLEARASLLESVRQERDRKPAGPDVARLPFGTVGQSAILEIIARRASRLADVVTQTGLSRHTARQIVDTLETYGLVVTTTVGAGPAAARWAILNERHPLSEYLRRFAATLRTEEQTKLGELPPRNLRRSAVVETRELPGMRELRTRVLLEVHRAGEITISELGRRIGSSEHFPLRQAARTLATAGLVEYGTMTGREIIRNIAASIAAEQYALLDAMRRFLDG